MPDSTHHEQQPISAAAPAPAPAPTADEQPQWGVPSTETPSGAPDGIALPQATAVTSAIGTSDESGIPVITES